MIGMRWLGWISVALAAPGCAEDLAPRSIVASPRILAIVADRPEAAPGEDVRLDGLVVDPLDRPVTFVWTACLRSEDLGGTQDEQYAQEPLRQGCLLGEPGVFPLETDGPTGLLSGVDTQLAFDNLEALAEAIGEDIDPALIRFVAETVGVPILVELAVEIEGEVVVRGFKRVLLSRRETPGTNPPAPRFRVGDVWMTGRGVAAPFTCVPEEGEGPVVGAAAEVTLAPDTEDEAWLETYVSLDARGVVSEREETAFYSWFAEAGSFDEEVTRPPVREETWKAPDAEGAQPLWLVVRDGHGGTSACGAEVNVGR